MGPNKQFNKRSRVSTGFRVSSLEIFLIYTNLHHFGECFHLIFLYITGYNNISWGPYDPRSCLTSHNPISRPPIPRIDAYGCPPTNGTMSCVNKRIIAPCYVVASSKSNFLRVGSNVDNCLTTICHNIRD